MSGPQRRAAKLKLRTENNFHPTAIPTARHYLPVHGRQIDYVPAANLQPTICCVEESLDAHCQSRYFWRSNPPPKYIKCRLAGPLKCQTTAAACHLRLRTRHTRTTRIFRAAAPTGRQELGRTTCKVIPHASRKPTMHLYRHLGMRRANVCKTTFLLMKVHLHALRALCLISRSSSMQPMPCMD